MACGFWVDEIWVLFHLFSSGDPNLVGSFTLVLPSKGIWDCELLEHVCIFLLIEFVPWDECILHVRICLYTE